MLDLQFICENADLVAENCRNRGVDVDVSRVVALRQQRGELQQKGDALRSEAKSVSKQTGQAKSAEERDPLIARGKELRVEVAASEEALSTVQCELDDLASQIPNLSHPDAPVGKIDKENIEVRRVGDLPSFDFKALDHVELAAKHDLVDFEGGARVAGSGFYFLKNEAVFLEMALIQFAMMKLRDRGFTVHSTPDLARQEVLQGTGYNPRGEETQIYSIANTDLSLVATAEIPLGGLLKDQIVDIEKLPLKYAGVSHCFRTEAGAAGKASRGLYRVHQFSKVEIFGFTAPDLDASNAFHDEIIEIEEEIFQELGIPYRVVDTCTGDLGGPAYRKFDLEAWMPGRGDEGEFGEVTSASNCTDYQARRLGIRTRIPDKKGTQFVHTLNGTAVAISRALVAILENYQRADGTIGIPEVLQKWVGREQIG
ncbi:MAG: seryl-tRNA synthetase [Porticoccaceae bacterium]|jgi:seryl-tRNA synthetase